MFASSVCKSRSRILRLNCDIVLRYVNRKTRYLLWLIIIYNPHITWYSPFSLNSRTIPFPCIDCSPWSLLRCGYLTSIPQFQHGQTSKSYKKKTQFHQSRKTWPFSWSRSFRWKFMWSLSSWIYIFILRVDPSFAKEHCEQPHRRTMPRGRDGMNAPNEIEGTNHHRCRLSPPSLRKVSIAIL